jgi:DUF1680 family protein/peroxiredoxin
MSGFSWRFLAIAALLVGLGIGNGGRAEDALLGTRPPEWQVEHWFNSPPLHLKDLKGRVVLVRWWFGPACPFCKATAPALKEFHETYKDRGLTVVGFYHHKDVKPLDTAAVEKLAADYGMQFPIAIDPDWRTLKDWWLNGDERKWTSVTFLLDRQGVIRHIHRGGAYVKGDKGYIALKAKIEELLKEQPVPAGAHRLAAVPFQDVHINDAFWSPRIRTNSTATIEANLRQCELTGRIKNFAVAGKLESGKHEGQLYNDSDVYKMIEGIAYALSTERNADLEKRTDAVIAKIAAAQQPDGYINTYYTLVKPEERWKNIAHGHEMYCAGHLIEAAVAYYQATGKKELLDVALKMADHIASVFGPDKRHDCCGHEEIELALVKLYRVTGEKRYLELAKFFLDTRGTTDGRRSFGDYAQDHKPIRQQTEVAGHAVRAMYLYSAMADVAAETGDKELMAALDKIWHDVVDRKMYLTGGIGPSAKNEGFTVPYDLPNDTAYAETCAAIGMALWNHRMFLMTGDGKYADILEREVYNGLLSGVSLSGDKFFYVNPLGSKGKHHRVPWFDCSCCPTNIVRYIPAIGERAYAYRDNDIYTVLYMSGTATIPLKDGKVKITQETNYPWDGKITIKLEPEKPFYFALHLRIPAWCRNTRTFKVRGVNHIDPSARVAGPQVLVYGNEWKAGDVIELEFDMPAERVYADPHVQADVGRVALMRGPIVYCLEGVDNDGQVCNLVLPKDAKLTTEFKKDLLGGVTVIRGDALRVSRDETGKLATKPIAFQAVPYSTWDNRVPGEMLVWLPETAELAEAAAR